MSAATHRYVHLIGSSRDRRRTVRALRKLYPLTPHAACTSEPKQPYLTDRRPWQNHVIITTPGQ